MFEGLLLPWQQIYHLALNSIFRTTPEVSSKLYFVEIRYVSEKLWLFNHKELIFGFQILIFFSLLSLLKYNDFMINFDHFFQIIYEQYITKESYQALSFKSRLKLKYFQAAQTH